MTRREFVLRSAASLAAAPCLSTAMAEPTRSKMGIATTSYMTYRRYRDTYEFLEQCHALGAAGIQSAMSGDPGRIRARAEELNMFIEVIIGLPKTTDTSAFEKTVQDAKRAGALCVRANAGGRRYEDFSTLAEYNAFADRSKAAIAAVVPICEKYKVPFALENHKDWTADQLVAILKGYSSEYVGACVDFGNDLALCEDPMEVVQKLAPYALTTHMKDMAMEVYDEGFLMSEMALGDGFLDLRKMISLVKQAHPKTNLNLEMITRDPLKIPCLTDRYWATFPERKDRYLKPAMALARSEAAKRGKALPRFSQMSPDMQLDAEARNVKNCLSYASEKLGL